mmetsp:Transcript_46255/g.83336  ORF Transcript_46255/g.83336 Transcript_46255/m.83336 type:complete len:223 (-) Transcript_46255:375-1043(-)
MATSFAPSPIASDILPFPANFTISTRLRFCCGERRQQIHAFAPIATLHKICFASASSLPELPSAMRKTCSTKAPSSTKAGMAAGFAFWIVSRAAFSMLKAISSEVAPASFTSDVSASTRLQDLAISMAVSVLSPVSIQTWTFISFSFWMASGTPSCSLSSMAVSPKKSSPCSSLAAQAVMRRSRSAPPAERAASYSLFHSSNSASSNVFWAITKVRNPNFPN